MSSIVGLGNPGEHHADRHNMGFMVVDRLAERAGVALSTKRFDGLYARGRLEGQDVLLVKPQTSMNASGDCVGPLARYHHIEPASVIVVHDEMDLPFGQLRLKRGGSAGGHNGLKSIIEALGTEEFVRLRVGVGRPGGAWGTGRGHVVSHVLSPFSDEEAARLPAYVDHAADAVRAVLAQGLSATMNVVNRRSVFTTPPSK